MLPRNSMLIGVWSVQYANGIKSSLKTLSKELLKENIDSYKIVGKTILCTICD